MNGILAVDKGTVTQSLYDLHYMYQCFSYEYFWFFLSERFYFQDQSLILIWHYYYQLFTYNFYFKKMISTKY